MDTQAKDALKSAGFDDSFWGAIIIQAENRKGFDEAERDAAADHYPCACGQLDPRLQDEYGVPFDDTQEAIGLVFSDAVDNDDFLQAALTLIDIERMSAELLAELDN